MPTLHSNLGKGGCPFPCSRTFSDLEVDRSWHLDAAPRQMPPFHSHDGDQARRPANRQEPPEHAQEAPSAHGSANEDGTGVLIRTGPACSCRTLAGDHTHCLLLPPPRLQPRSPLCALLRLPGRARFRASVQPVELRRPRGPPRFLLHRHTSRPTRWAWKRLRQR